MADNRYRPSGLEMTLGGQSARKEDMETWNKEEVGLLAGGVSAHVPHFWARMIITIAHGTVNLGTGSGNEDELCKCQGPDTTYKCNELLAAPRQTRQYPAFWHCG